MKQILVSFLIVASSWVSSANAETQAELKKRLTPEQYRCTQEAGTEKPFQNAYWNLKDDGIYVDVVSGEPLFSSLDKYDSGSGWPSFTKTIDDGVVKTSEDKSAGMVRTELRSKNGNSHLGHLFDDGPAPGGNRFCINSASLKFVPVDELKSKGLGKYLFRFKDKKKWETLAVAGGCFWGVEELFRKQKGVIETQAGYAGGFLKNPKYSDVKKGDTGHAESVEILFDPKQTNREALLLYFFKIHDPTTPNQQGNDKGTQYRSVIFYANDGEKKEAEKVLARVKKSNAWKKPVVTELVKVDQFWRAEDEHQKYLERIPNGYTCHFERKMTF